MEWNWHYDLNYNQKHFPYTEYPLTFSSSLDKPRPAIWNYVSEYEMMNNISNEMHEKGKLTMGNGFGWLPFAPGILDLFGSEFSWYAQGTSDDMSSWIYPCNIIPKADCLFTERRTRRQGF